MLPLFVVLALVGCKGSREKDVVGTWSMPQMTVTATEDKNFKSTIGPLTLEGTWSVEGNDVTFQPKTMMGKSISEVKSKLLNNPALAASGAQGAQFVKDMDKPNVMTLSDDGKSMATNKAKDTNSGPPVTLTKS